ncbi:MAG: c-type cytochrome, partial [Acidobacteriota bacterium]|nr:c-type cytochrome [Acidobacteriota bacterium]
MVLILALAFLAQQAQQPQQPPKHSAFLISRPVPDPAAVERGKALFVPSCGFCHGPDATGGEGPDLVRSAIALRDEDGETIGPVIHGGRPGMPAFAQMSEVQIKDIAAFLRFRQQEAIDRTNYQVQNVNTGDAKKGEAYFTAHCASCHSPAKDLKGIATKYEPTALITRILYPKGAESAVTVTEGGTPVTGTLVYLDDFEVGLRDEAGVYRGFTR